MPQHKTKLTVDHQWEMLGRCLRGESQRSLAPLYGISQSAISLQLKKLHGNDNIATALEAADVYYRRNPHSRSRVTHPARTLSDQSRHAIPALTLPPAPPAGGSLNFHGAMGMLCQAARAEPNIANWQHGPNPIREPDAAGKTQPLPLLCADSAKCDDSPSEDLDNDDALSGPGATGQRQLECADSAGCASQRLETIPARETEANKGQGKFQPARSTAQSDFESTQRECDDATQPRLDQLLESRVLLRTREGKDRNRIIEKLLERGLMSIDICLGAHRDMGGLTTHGFDQVEADLVLLEDNSWKPASAWLDDFISSLPEWLRTKHTLEPFKEAVRQAEGINGLDDLFRRCDQLEGIPYLIKHQIKIQTSASAHSVREGLDIQAKTSAGDESQKDQDAVGADPSPAKPDNLVCDEEGAELLLALAQAQDLPKSDVYTLQRAVHACVPRDHRNTLGFNGTLQPRALIDLIVSGVSALKTAHNVAEVIFVDLGCSCGNALWGAALSGEFQAVYGVDFPENEGAILMSVERFKVSAAAHQLLRAYTKQFEDVMFRWRQCGDETVKDLDGVLGEEIQSPVLLYWFCTGWDQKDINHCCVLISRSQKVLGVVCVPRDQGRNAETLLRSLNSIPGQKRFYMQAKNEKVPYSGNGSHTAFVFLRNNDFEYNLKTRPDPKRGDRVEVIFKESSSVQWYPGAVERFGRTDEQLQIRFDDNDTESFARDDPEVVFLPTEDNQWRQTLSLAGEDVGAKYAFCNRCADNVGIGEESRCCARCMTTVYHLKCLSGPAPEIFLCPFCRAELADIGHRQIPQYECTDTSPAKKLCFSCTTPIFKLQKKIQADPCRVCKALFCRSCSSRTSNMSLPFSCPACIGISAHDAALKSCFEVYIDDRLLSIVEPVGGKPGLKPREKKRVSKKQDSALFMDEVGQAIVSLQQTCQWELLNMYLPFALKQLKYQVDAEENPSMGPFDQLNLLGIEGGPEFELVDRGAKLYADHARMKAISELQLLKASSKKPSHHRIVASTQPLANGIKIGFLTADLRRTPWWQLMKTALQALATGNTLHIFSRPPVQLDGDPHYVALQKLCSLIEFEEGASDAYMAECIGTHTLDVVMDAGGPTYGSFAGVMALLQGVLRGAHLGYPGTQPGGHIDFTVADQYVVPPGSLQAEKAQEAFMFMRCYQPNGSFRTTVTVAPVRKTTRSDWNLPDSAFVFACFCRPGRITSGLMQTFAEILISTDNSVLWIRNTPLPAAMRIKRSFLIKGIAANRLILACDVPNEEHMERLRHADLVLDTEIYGGHTTASDSLLQGVPFLALKGEWWHGLVSTSLVYNMMGDAASQFVCCGLEAFKARAVFFATTGVKELEHHRRSLQAKVDSGEGICDGESWIRDYVNGIKEFVQQKSRRSQLTDVFLCEVVNKVSTHRSRTFLNERGDVIGLIGGHGHMAGTAVNLCDSAMVNSEEVSQRISAKRNLQGGEEGAAAKRHKVDSAQQIVFGASRSAEDDGSDDGSDSVPRTKAEKNRIGWLFDLALKDPDLARKQAYDHLAPNLPAGVEIAKYARPNGSMVWAIQLPCKVQRISSKTGIAKQLETEFPLLYVTEPVHGRGSDLRAGQVIEKGMYITGYDGKFGHKSELKPGQSVSHLVSLSYGLQQHVDSALIPDWRLLEECSLGGKINHAYGSSNVNFIRPEWKSPISHRPTSIYIKAKSGVEPHAVLEAFYTSGAAERDHGILRHVVPEGRNNIKREALLRVESPVTEALEVLRTVAGFDLLDVCGRGSEGVAVKVQQPGGALPFVVKINKRTVSELSRAGVLCEAALMHRARDHKDPSIGIFSPALCSESGWGTCAAALLRVKEGLVAAVAMECFDLDGSNIWRPLGRRFRKGEVADLLRDVQSVLRGTVQATVWMHKSGLAHGDLKDSNMLLKRLAQTPADPRIAFCVVGGVTYQIVFSDWGHARWSGQNEKASHAFSKLQHGGKDHCTTHIIDAASKMDRISPVQLRELNLAYGFQLRNPSVFRHPGSGTVLFRCPEYDREFKSGEGAVQRRFDQAADMWALGVLCVYLLAPPLLQDGQTDAHLRDLDWASRLKKASSTAERKLKAERSSGARLGGKAMDAALQPDDSGSWIATMVRVHYKKNLWPILKDLLSGERNSEWLSWLDLLHGLLTYSSEVRLQANDALEHRFFLMDL